MISWIYITLITVSTVVIIVLILIIIRKKCSQPTSPTEIVMTDTENIEASFDEGSSKRSNQHVFRQRKPFFSWSDHPGLAAEAVENGWPRFTFASLVVSDDGRETDVEMSWEVFDESVDYMQKIRLNNLDQTTLFCVVRAALPLPGPQFAHTSFPKEAYFEIRVLPDHDQEIEDDFDVNDKIAQVKFEEVEDEMVLVAIGLSGGSSSHFPLKIPGSFLGSVGFDSTGSVYLDGKKLVGKSENEEWGRAGNVIGCGFNPSQRKVFFTLNSQLVYEIRCKAEEFGHPLYPTLAANGDVSVVVNLGQSPFKFDPANSHRTQNPCFISKNASCNTAPFYELDSKELFSMGRIDGKWKHWSSEQINEYDQMSEADLFEIVAR